MSQNCSIFTSFFNFRHKFSLAYPPHGPTDRFKVVKILTSIPLRRGRWNVVDYPDKEKTTSKEPPSTSMVVQPAASIPPTVQPAPSLQQAQSAVTADCIPKSETDSNVSSLSVQPPLQPQQPPNFSGKQIVLKIYFFILKVDFELCTYHFRLDYISAL